MRLPFSIFASSLLLLAGCERLPPGARRTDVGSQHHDFKLSADGSTLVYIDGEGDHRTYLVRRRLSDRSGKKFRAPGRRLIGPVAVSGDGSKAVVGSFTTEAFEDGETITGAAVEFDLNTGEFVERPVVPPNPAQPSLGWSISVSTPPMIRKNGAWEEPWTRRKTEILGEHGGKLYVALVSGEGRGVWTLEPDRSKFDAYRKAIDASKGSRLLVLVLGGAVLVVFMLMVGLTRGDF